MQELRWVQLTRDEIDAFLGRGGTGVISFGTAVDEPPFSIPVSYGYFADEGHFYFRLSFPADHTGGKATVIDRPVSFVVYGDLDDRWQSVVAQGTLEEVADAPYDSMAVQAMWDVQIPAVDIFEDPREDVTFRDFRMVPETVNGRGEVLTED
ncbi:pyridoxamine 5'-phosphate oxidase family protein [Natrialbaceae archaeon A-CW1-1]